MNDFASILIVVNTALFLMAYYMPYRPNDEENGFEETRFEQAVDENFYCSICLNVVKEARMCRNNEHIFCRYCITEHLRVNAQRCPQCQEKLTVDTLHPARIINNMVAKLKIKCDYVNRGCPEFITLEFLERHVENCGFAPVLCSNERCGLEINKRDKFRHETELCEYREITSHDCRMIREDIETLLRSVINHDDSFKLQMAEIDGRILKADQKIDEKVDMLTIEMTEIKKEMTETKKDMSVIKQNISSMTKEMEQLKTAMNQMLEKMTIFEKVTQKLPSSVEGILNAQREDILIAGGNPSSFPSSSAEIFSWKEEHWIKIAAMENNHVYASSFIYSNTVFVVGGFRCRSIETLDLNLSPLTWKKFPRELPYKCLDHQTVVYQQKIFHIGGYNYKTGTESAIISEMQVSSTSHVLNEVCCMSEPRRCHATEVVGDKILIFGGQRNDVKAMSGVIEFDPQSLTCKEMPPLPYAMAGMATVCWRDQVILLGGRDCNEKELNDVIMYDSRTGKITVLPSMLKKRCRCSAVITGDTIVVMGGYSDEDEVLKLIECFKIGTSSSWSYLSSMNEFRRGAVAETLPAGRKYY
ncbi:uncharacterized protein LOC124452963 [Xenia sp. Carnegie-2017]|uniref:uncharacterized protein LOC124452963 n=1 Tax=Xenia sp. Carnegie-2017 TaxID=2897299 RepID=UPI001F04639D|nr:uncharacterized protein LOC124452963 [Xenia sp. Carnegie-2017]